MYVPPGFTTVTPYLFVADAERFVEFIGRAFDAEELLRSTRPDGRIANAQVRVGTSMLMVSEASPEYPPTRAAFYLYVEDADAAMARALQHGAALELAVGDMSYGDRQGGVRDPHGNLWWISQRLVEAPYSA